MARVLLVDDDVAVLRMLERYLGQEGFQVETATSSKAAFQSLQKKQPDIILLDISLPDENGLEIVKKIRLEDQDVGIVMVTGKVDVIDRVLGLELGADDYISKPFHLREILARINNILRRRGYFEKNKIEKNNKSHKNNSSKSIVYFEGWEADLAARFLKAPDGSPVTLTSGEFRLLEIFLRNPQRVLSRDQILDFVAARQWEPFDRSVDTRVRRLRKKIEKTPNDPEMIKTIRGEGYLFSVAVTETPNKSKNKLSHIL